MIPAQLIRALGQACRLLGLSEAHAAAVDAGDDAPIDVALDLVDAMLERLERQAAPARTPDEPGEPAVSTRMARTLTRIRELAAAGRSDPEIAVALDREIGSVAKLRARYDIPPGVRPGGASHATGWQDVIRGLHAEGLTTAQIAERSGYTVRTVQQRLHELGLRAVRG